MTKLPSPFEGAMTFGDNITLPEVWQGLHADAQSWERAALAADTLRQRAGIDESSQAMFDCLSDCEAPRWYSLIEAIGITQIGAIALSWCKGAQFEDVSDALGKAVQAPEQFDMRTISFLNPTMRPPTRVISEMAEFANQDVGRLALFVLADELPLEMDVTDAWLGEIPKGLAWAIAQRAGPVAAVSV